MTSEDSKVASKGNETQKIEARQRVKQTKMQSEPPQQREWKQGGAETRPRRERWPLKHVIKKDASKAPRLPPKPNVLTTGNSSHICKDEDAAKIKARAILHVGTGPTQKTFHIETTILCNSSANLRAHFENDVISSDVNLPTEDPTTVEMFIDWAKRPKQPISYTPGQYSSEPWLSHAASAYILGQKLEAILFAKYALSQFIQNCALIALSPWKSIEEKVPLQSPLTRFSDHWVAWNTSLCGSGINEYSGLKAANLATQVKASTRDPRILELEHWYSSCGDDINAKCEHDPIFLENEREKRRLERRPPPPEWGAEYEGTGDKSTISSPSPLAKHKPSNLPFPPRTPRR